MLLPIHTSFTDSKKCVNPCPCESEDLPCESWDLVGKNLGEFCLLSSPGDAKSLRAVPHFLRGQFLRIFDSQLSPFLLFATFLFGAVLFPNDLWAHTGDVLSEEITKVEKLFTGGYMRLGLLGVCGFAAIYGIIKQSGWVFASGILGCVFAYLVKDWILGTFTMVI
ncbi:MAG: hypothetical protein BGO67_00490 [Alphaproteobacteria bacterium 41-28]|nr:MAG: hypothetical protein BGO67_00490 [Alphaproteobacteria bacterium 41-28]